MGKAKTIGGRQKSGLLTFVTSTVTNALYLEQLDPRSGIVAWSNRLSATRHGNLLGRDLVIWVAHMGVLGISHISPAMYDADISGMLRYPYLSSPWGALNYAVWAREVEICTSKFCLSADPSIRAYVVSRAIISPVHVEIRKLQ